MDFVPLNSLTKLPNNLPDASVLTDDGILLKYLE